MRSSFQCKCSLLQTSGIREPLRGSVKTANTSDDVEEESVTPDNSIHAQTILSTNNMIESSVNSSKSNLHHTSNSHMGTSQVGAVEQLYQPETGMVNVRVRQSSDHTLPVLPSSIRPTSSVVSTPSGTVLAVTSGLAVTDGVVAQSQYSRPAVRMLVSSGGRRVAVPVVKKQLATPASQAAAVPESHSAISGQVVYGFLQPRETLTANRGQTLLAANTLPQTQDLSIANVTQPETVPSLIGGSVEMTQYLTTGVVPEHVEYDTCQPLNQQQHR